MSFDKHLIAKNFSRGAKKYDEVALVQQQAAQELVALIQPYLKKDSQILDLGSGTSFVAKEILACRHSERSEESQELDLSHSFEMTEVDLSAEMLQSWRDRPSNVKTIQADFENLSFEKNSFDLITSSFALQWVADFEKNFSRFFSLLKPRGIFAFCLPTKGSLPELNSFNINEFPSADELKRILKLSGFSEKFFVQKTVEQKFTTNRDALRFLKRIGADSPAKDNNKTGLPLKGSIYKNAANVLSWQVSHFIVSRND